MKTHKNRLTIFLGLIMVLALLAMACRAAAPVSSAPNNSSPAQQEATVEPRVVQPTQPGVVENQPPAQNQPVVSNLPANATEQEQVLAALYARVNPAVVNITIYATQNGQLLPLAQGSGFLYDDQGHIVTNAHVVQEAEQVEVGFSDGSIYTAKVVGLDLNSDLAAIQVEKVPAGVQPLPLGDIKNVGVGETVVAIGNPFGLEGTLTLGIVSAIGRTIPALNTFSIPQAIQTDAAINPGNSGGPLLSLQGQVIGVNAQIETGGTSRSNSGVGFAIPVSIVQQVIPELIKNGKYDWTWVGVTGGPLSPLQVQAMNLPVDKGAYISTVVSGGPAEAAGLRGSSGTQPVNNREVEVGGDVITAIDNTPVNTFNDLLVYVALQTRPGQEVNLTIVRDGKTIQVPVKLQARPETLPNTSTSEGFPTLPPGHP